MGTVHGLRSERSAAYMGLRPGAGIERGSLAYGFDALAGQRRQGIPSQSPARDDGIGTEFQQRQQRKRALVQVRMGDTQAGVVDGLARIEQQVEIQDARPPALPSFASEAFF